MSTATERVQALDFKSNRERHNWLVEHQAEILHYNSMWGRDKTLKEYHMGAGTLQKILDGKFKVEPVEVVEPKSNGFIPMLKAFCEEHEALVEENTKLKQTLESWQKIAGGLSLDIQKLIRNGQ